MKQINLALLGMGRIGKIHFNNIQQHFPHAKIVTVGDPQIDETSFKKQYGDVFISNDPNEVIERADVDAVLICTPTSSHADLIQKAILNGKHVFCEKPMDLSLEKTAALSAMAADMGIKLMLGFNRRFDPDFMEARKAIMEGKIGNVQIVKITSRDPGLPPIDYIKNSGGLFLDMAIHDFDMARYIMGKEVVEVYARGLVLVDQAVGEAGDIDTALTTLIFEDGTYAVIDNSRKAVYGYDQRLEIFGSGGMIQVENSLHNRNIIFNEKGIHQALPLDFFMDRYTKSYLKEMELFIDALLNDTPMPVGGYDGYQATRIAIATRKSMEEGRSVRLSEITIKLKTSLNSMQLNEQTSI
ncbi:inositol 2-dehydrogenase [Chitinophagaceae bacterium LB-8]|uniref:Inositol 2-dehydrogenase n=1 Tax=Paraflavisolibacter caeni TaxID=2982496 RepID=A0A9X2XVM7_9BACT|nr:inositol 2-dehydrogenase [Paraflavisolibacter caeni]MCU7549436.1 inositol 2-dehydrogenase [Paraflavisolibacter caeni]